MRPRKALPLLLALPLPLLLAWGDKGGTEARRDARSFILETLRKQEGSSWDRVGQYLLWSYGFDRAGCELSVSRSAEFSDRFSQVIPLAEAQPRAPGDSELNFECRNQRPCVRYQIANPERSDSSSQARTSLLVMDPDDLPPLQQAFEELHRLCRDPYGPRPADTAPFAVPTH